MPTLKAADCWAIRWLNTKESFDDYFIRAIERDLERLDAASWLKMLGHPKKRTNLFHCLKI